MFSYPHTIDNGLGERITFRPRSATPEGESLEVESTVQPGMAPPMHAHLLQDEAFTVDSGRAGFVGIIAE